MPQISSPLQIPIDFSSMARATEELERLGRTSSNTATAIGRFIDQSTPPVRRFGQITMSELQQVRRGLDAYTQDVRQMGQATENAYEQSARAAARGNATLGREVEKRARLVRGGLQNVSFQIQDIATQLTMGTEPVLVMAQQLPQLVGGLGVYGAALGGVVAVLGGVYLATQRASATLEDYNDAFDRATDASEAYAESLNKVRMGLVDVGDASVAAARATDRIAQATLVENFQSYLQGLGGARGDFLEAIQDTFDLSNLDITGRGGPGPTGPTDEVVRLRDLFRELSTANISTDSGAEQALRVTNQLITELESVLDVSEGVTEEQANLFNTLTSVRDTLTQITDQYEDVIGSAEGIRAAEEARNELFAQQLEKLQASADSYDDALGSAEGLRKAEEGIRQMAYDAAEEAARLEENMLEAWRNGEDLSQLSIEKGVNAAAEAARELSIQLGISEGSARRIIQMGSGKDVGAGRGSVVPDNIDSYIRSQGGTFEDFEDGASGSGGGSSAPVIDMQERMPVPPRRPIEAAEDALQSYMDEFRENIRLTERENDVLSIKDELIEAIGEKNLEYTEANIEATARELQAMQEHADNMEEQGQRLADSFGDAFEDVLAEGKSFSDALYRIVVDMSANIVRDGVNNIQQAFTEAFGASSGGGASGGGFMSALFSVVGSGASLLLGGGGVASPNAGGGTNPALPGIPSRMGNVFSGGEIVPFRDGGVVDQPSYFPMSNGRTGSMAEDEAEAIMPLTRTRDGKLGVKAEKDASSGGDGPVNIEQHFHISANGDESIRRIIATEAPKIAEMSKRAVMQGRRQGGAMKNTFG